MLALFKVLMEVFRTLKIPVVVAFDQLEDLLLARRSDDAHRTAEAFFAGIVQVMHQIDGICFLIFAERGLWNRFVPSLDGYIQDRLNNPVHVPKHGTMKALRLEAPPADLVRRVVEARLRPCLDELPDGEPVADIFPFTDEQVHAHRPHRADAARHAAAVPAPVRSPRLRAGRRDRGQEPGVRSQVTGARSRQPRFARARSSARSAHRATAVDSRDADDLRDGESHRGAARERRRRRSDQHHVQAGRYRRSRAEPTPDVPMAEFVDEPDSTEETVPDSRLLLTELPLATAAAEVPPALPFPSAVVPAEPPAGVVRPTALSHDTLAELWEQEQRAAHRKLEPEGALTGATRELQAGLGAFLSICHEHGVKVGPWRLQHVVPEWTFGDHPTYGAVTIAHWACKDGQPWKVGIRPVPRSRRRQAEGPRSEARRHGHRAHDGRSPHPASSRGRPDR